MRSSPSVEAARQFLKAVWDGPAPTDRALAAALDRLVVAYHETPDAAQSDSEVEAPRQDGAALYKEVAARFPDYGLYPVAEPLEQVNQSIRMGGNRRQSSLPRCTVCGLHSGYLLPPAPRDLSSVYSHLRSLQALR